MFIGYYNIANFITLTGLVSSVSACFLAQSGHFKASVFVFLIAGLCDMFDGRVARATNKGDNRRKLFGIQIDTVCDMVSFGVAPCIIAYSFGFRDIADCVIYAVFVCCGAVRLAYFNTQAISDTEDMNMKFFTGMPIPTICFVLPPLALLMTLLDINVIHTAFKAAYLVVAALFIINVKIKKPGFVTGLCFIAAMAGCLIALLLLGDMHVLA